MSWGFSRFKPCFGADTRKHRANAAARLFSVFIGGHGKPAALHRSEPQLT